MWWSCISLGCYNIKILSKMKIIYSQLPLSCILLLSIVLSGVLCAMASWFLFCVFLVACRKVCCGHIYAPHWKLIRKLSTSLTQPVFFQNWNRPWFPQLSTRWWSWLMLRGHSVLTMHIMSPLVDTQHDAITTLWVWVPIGTKIYLGHSSLTSLTLTHFKACASWMKLFALLKWLLFCIM